ncbi:MAG: hypothetical protein C4326_07935 [Ignavibacteria bacterium]
MTLTILASLFLGLILLVALIGFTVAAKRPHHVDELPTEKCSICRSKFSTSVLIERQIGDYKLLYFCPSCITALHDELVSRN